MTKTKMKAKEKLPVEKWHQIFDSMNRFGLGICQRLLTISGFWYFSLYFLLCFQRPLFSHLFMNLGTRYKNSLVLNVI